MKISEIITEGWSKKYKRSIDCSHPKGFSQRAHCQGRKKHNEDVAEDALNEWVDPGAPCTHCGKSRGQHSVRFDRKNPNLSFIDSDDEWNDLEMSNAEDHEYVPSREYKPLSQKEAELVGFDNLNVDMPDDIYDRINSVRQRISRVGSSAGQLTRIKEQGVTEDSMSLHDWFGKGKHGGAGGGGWDRYNTKGERIGKCGERSSDEGKPKCLSKSKAASLRASGGKKAIAAAVNKKRRNDSNPDRRGAAINVSSKKAK